MSQTPSRDPVDLVQTNNTGHENTSAECMHSQNPTSTPEDPPATNTKRMPSSTPTPIQEDPPTSHQPEVVAHEPSEDSSTHPRSSPPPLPSSKTDILSEPPTDTNAIANEQNPQIDQTQLPQDDLGSSKDPLETYDWAELEDRFHAEMKKCANRENGIQEEFKELLNVNLLLPASLIYAPRGVFITTLPILTNISSSKHIQPPAPCTKSRGQESGMSTPLCIPQILQFPPLNKRNANNQTQSLLTRMTYVQQREKTLEEKRTHCKPIHLFSYLIIRTERLAG